MFLRTVEIVRWDFWLEMRRKVGIRRILVCPSHPPTVLSYDLETIWRKK